jgi:hypothetical protein
MKKLFLVALLSLSRVLIFTGEAILAQSNQIPVSENEVSYYGITSDSDIKAEIQFTFNSKKKLITNLKVEQSCINVRCAMLFSYCKKIKVDKKDQFKCKDNGGISGIVNNDGTIEGELSIRLLCKEGNQTRNIKWSATKKD